MPHPPDSPDPPPADRTPPVGTAFVSAQDVEDADDVLFAHPPRPVTRWMCGCGEPYPCPEVSFAHLVKHARVAP
ncbi:hypothetical protein GA0070616_0848 [Micromonospora nigra]|uniref:Uncharacterized protein n=1 Tax=Micromonospora nigra TaxID=145857 RepID=A0A1C6RF96_9ACTN|nr:hypothetical protein [Micromonospora nigra]SCL15843.1 hypothetical protein GA0070616_0848 [Micromonospora nigra]